MTLPVSPDDIERAAGALGGAILATPAVAAPALSERTGAQLFLKLESLQVTGSFKPRGALNKLLGLDDAQSRRGVIAMSAGNHAQGVAYHARRLGLPATIVMPRATPFTKVDRTAAYGARVVLEGDDLAEAAAHAHGLAAREGLTFIHPYDDPAIIAGQGTVGRELLAAIPDLDALIVPVGGGGLISGIAIAAKALKPGIEIVGVQAAAYPAMAARLGRASPSSGPAATLAEGIAVKEPGDLTSAIVAAQVDELVLVSEAGLEQALHLLATTERLVVEGAGAAPLAALLATPDRFAGRRVGLIVSGGNIDARVLASILMRGLVAAGRLARLRVEIADQPGWLARVAGLIGSAGGNIVEVYHQRLYPDVPVIRTDIEIVVETRDLRHLAAIEDRLQEAGFTVVRLGLTAAAG